MPSTSSTLARAVLSGSLASLFSAAVLALRGVHENRSAAAPINAVSHWVHGDKALQVDRADVGHTALGMAIHHASAVFWGVLYELVLQRIAASGKRRGPAGRVGRPSAAAVLGTAAAVSAVAALTDLRLVPSRLTPGFEHRVRPGSVFLAYVAVAAGLALAATQRD